MRCKKKRLTLSAFWQEQKQDIWTKMLRKLEGRNNFLAGLVFLVCIVCCGDGLMIWCFPIYPGGTRAGEPCGWLYRLYRVYRVYTAVQLTMWLSVTDGVWSRPVLPSLWPSDHTISSPPSSQLKWTISLPLQWISGGFCREAHCVEIDSLSSANIKISKFHDLVLVHEVLTWMFDNMNCM